MLSIRCYPQPCPKGPGGRANQGKGRKSAAGAVHAARPDGRGEPRRSLAFYFELLTSPSEFANTAANSPVLARLLVLQHQVLRLLYYVLRLRSLQRLHQDFCCYYNHCFYCALLLRVLQLPLLLRAANQVTQSTVTATSTAASITGTANCFCCVLPLRILQNCFLLRTRTAITAACYCLLTTANRRSGCWWRALGSWFLALRR